MERNFLGVFKHVVYSKMSILLFILTLVLSNLQAQSIGLEKIIFTPQWIPQAQFAGYYAAKELGYYEQEGLDVEIKHPTASINVMDMLNSGKTDIITSMAAIALLEVDQGVDLVNIMQLMPNSQLVIVSSKPLDGNLQNLQGKKIATWKSNHSTASIAVLKRQNIDVEWVRHLAGVNVFLSDCVDAMLAMEYNELQSLIECGRKIDSTQIIAIKDIENIPEDGLYALSGYVKKNPEIISKFCRASMKGWMWVAENRDEALEYVMKVVGSHKVQTNRYHQKAMLGILLSNGVGKNIDSFKLSKNGFINIKSLLLESGMITKDISYDNFVPIIND